MHSTFNRPTRRAALALGAAAFAAPAVAAARAIRVDFEGSRPFPFDPKAKRRGEQPYRGESGQRYDGGVARNFGNGLIRIADDVDDLKVENVEAVNFYRLIEGDEGVSLTGFVLRNVKARGFERSVMRLRGASRNGLIQDVWADSEAQMGDPFPIGFHFDEHCRDIRLERCQVFRCRTPRVEGKYRQGDGFADEGGCSGMAYVDTLAQECTDAGYDLKSTSLTLLRARAVRNRRNFRLWSDNRLDHIISEDPLGAHVSTHGKGPRTIRIERLVARSTTPAPLFRTEARDGTRISIGGYDIQIPNAAPLIRNEGPIEIDWGPQGSPRPERRRRKR